MSETLSDKINYNSSFGGIDNLDVIDVREAVKEFKLDLMTNECRCDYCIKIAINKHFGKVLCND